MKINWKDKNVKVTAVILLVILVPILFNQGKTIITGLITAYYMRQPKLVQIQKPQETHIYPEYETTGRIEAKDSINVIARVDGWLEKVCFEEGDKVKKGQQLFKIEPDEYILAANNAQATVSENSAVYHNSQIDLARAEKLLKEDFVSREYYDNALMERNKNRAALDGAIAQRNKARLDLSYTNITSPMNGRIGKKFISAGNYVTASSGPMATIYSTSPMKVIFTLKSADFIEMKKYYKEAYKNDKSGVHHRTPIDVSLKLADGSIYDVTGKIEFVDNQVDESTGSVTLRAIFDNPDELLVPGDFVNVILKIKKQHNVMLIPQTATKTDVGTGYYVWVAKESKDKNGKTIKVTEKRDVKVNNNIDNNWVVEEGLDYNDEVIVKGIQDIYKSGQEIKTEPYKEEVKDEKSSESKAK